MALNNMGLGFSLTADDQASLQLMRVAGSLGALKVAGDNAAMSFDNVAGRMRDASTGRFAKKPEGMLNPSFIGEINGQLASMGQKFAIVGAGMIGGLGYASMKASEFAKAIALVASEADLSLFPQEKMADVAQELAQKFGRLPVQEANALYKAVALGANDATKATQIMTGANLLAVAGNADLELTMNALGGALNAYGGDMSKATDFSDVLFTTMKNGNTTVGELAASIGHITSEAANLKIPFSEIMGAVAVMTNKGVAAAEAVTGLKAALQSVQHPTSEAAAEAARLGIKFTQAELRAKGLPAFLKEITSSSKFTAESMSKLFAGEGANAIAQVTGDMSALDNVMKEMGNRAGATAKGFEILSNTTDFQMQKINALKDSALILIGDAIKPLAVHVLKFGVMALEWFTKLPKSVIKFGATIMAMAGVLFTAIGGLLATGAAIGGIIIAAKAIAIGIAVAAAGFAIFLAVLIPVIAAAYTLYQVWTKDIGGFATTIRGYLDKVALAWKALVQLFTDGGFSGGVLDELNNGNQGIKSFAITVFLWFNRVKNFFAGLSDSFSSGLERLAPIFQRIVGLISAIAQRFMPVQDSLSGAKDKFDAFGGAGKKTGDFLVKVIELVAKGIEKALNFVDGFLETFSGMGPLIDAIVDAGKAFFGVLGQIFGQNDKMQTNADTWRTIGQVLGVVATVVIGGLAVGFRVLGGLIEWVGGLIDGVSTFFSGMIGNIATGIRLIIAIFTGDWGQAWELAKKLVTDWAATIIGAFAKVIAGAAGLIDSLGKLAGQDLGLKNKVNDMAAGLTAPAGGGAGSAIPAIDRSGQSNALVGSSMASAVQAQNQAQGNAQIAGAVAASGQKPVDITLKNQLVLDGNQIHESTQKAAVNANGRAFAPTPSPT